MWLTPDFSGRLKSMSSELQPRPEEHQNPHYRGEDYMALALSALTIWKLNQEPGCIFKVHVPKVPGILSSMQFEVPWRFGIRSLKQAAGHSKMLGNNESRHLLESTRPLMFNGVYGGRYAGFSSILRMSHSECNINCSEIDVNPQVHPRLHRQPAQVQPLRPFQPKPGVPFDTLTSFTNRLETENDPSTITVTEDPSDQFLAYWFLPLLPNQVKTYLQDPSVGAIIPWSLNLDDLDPTPIIGGKIPASSPTPNKLRSAPSMHQHDKYDGQITVPLSALQQQTPATLSLRVISQPERVALSTIPSYAYQIEPLGYSMIYIIDNGVDPTSLTIWTYTTVRGQHGCIRVYNVDPQGYPFDLRVNDKYDADPGQHGTCIFSKAFGLDYGVSKRASVTVAVLPMSIRGQLETGVTIAPFRYRTVTDALNLILQDVQAKKLQYRAVVSMAFGITPLSGANRIPILGDPLFPMYLAAQALINAGVVLVTASENFSNTSPNGKQIKQHPAVRSLSLPIIVVGAVDSNGYILDFTQYQSGPNFPAAAVDVYAPGDQIACDACSATAGMIAYFFSAPGHLEKLQSNFARISQTGIDWSNTVKTYVKTKAYPRAPNHPDVNVIWNSEVPELVGGGFTCSIHPGFRKRQDPASRSKRGLGSINCQPCLALERERGFLGIHCQYSFAWFNYPLDYSTNLVFTFKYCCPATPPSSTAEAPQATCTAVTKLNSVDVAIWANYITDDGAALEAAEKDTCPGVGVTNWSVTSISRVWTAPDGTQWTANQEFQFSLTRVTHPTVLQCISKAIIKAGGPADTQDCPFTSGVGVP
ncbi:hypothetical protein NA56DRAFT_696164 [Hyaloscypha hepaticicola]|uniref:Uncharacterized protein n=1 Tax=Hyaloscypha hepaticicola TaxID=2082293 RepID=A0A2J6QQ49_9HELO|nr:hypothetical protein NA56DRAFT_696164 [Hyaloscypha hepaticicola]